MRVVDRQRYSRERKRRFDSRCLVHTRTAVLRPGLKRDVKEQVRCVPPLRVLPCTLSIPWSCAHSSHVSKRHSLPPWKHTVWFNVWVAANGCSKEMAARSSGSLHTVSLKFQAYWAEPAVGRGSGELDSSVDIEACVWEEHNEGESAGRGKKRRTGAAGHRIDCHRDRRGT